MLVPPQARVKFYSKTRSGRPSGSAMIDVVSFMDDSRAIPTGASDAQVHATSSTHPRTTNGLIECNKRPLIVTQRD
jgi:hypothetical protein